VASEPAGAGRNAAISGCWKSNLIESSDAKKKNVPTPCFIAGGTHAATSAAEVLRIAWLALASGVSVNESSSARLARIGLSRQRRRGRDAGVLHLDIARGKVSRVAVGYRDRAEALEAAGLSE
jgi:hypothetical protein